MTVGAWRKGGVALALVAGVCGAAAYAQQSRQTSGAREVPLPAHPVDRGRPCVHAGGPRRAARGAAGGRSADVRFSRSAASNAATSSPISCPTCLPRPPAPLPPGRSAWRFAAPRSTAFPTVSRSGRFSKPCSRQAIWTWPSSSRRRSRPSHARSAGCRTEEVESFKSAETFLRKVLEKPFPRLADAPHVGAARGLESLARLNRKVASLDEETIARLRIVASTLEPSRASVQRNALAALIAALGVDADTLEIVLARPDPEVRRLAVLALSGSGSAIDDEDRIGYIRKALSDTSYMVRLEAVRAWTRRGVKAHGCQPLLDALNDQSVHVVLAALDALGDVCRDDASITTRMASEARTPRPQGRWQREMHAFVALAKRDRERAGDQPADFRDAHDVAGPDVRRQGRRDRRRHGRADAAGVGSGGQRRRSGADALAPADRRRQRSASSSTF